MRRTVGADLASSFGGVKGSMTRARWWSGRHRIGASVGVKIAQEAAGVRTNGALRCNTNEPSFLICKTLNLLSDKL